MSFKLGSVFLCSPHGNKLDERPFESAQATVRVAVLISGRKEDCGRNKKPFLKNQFPIKSFSSSTFGAVEGKDHWQVV